MKRGDVISYLEMCREEGVNLQRGMNYGLRNGYSIILMSLRRGAPYADRVEENGKVLIYEGHDEPRTKGGPDPKTVDQPRFHAVGGKPTQNGYFCEAVERYRKNPLEIERVRVYEKIKAGIWVYSGGFLLENNGMVNILTQPNRLFRCQKKRFLERWFQWFLQAD